MYELHFSYFLYFCGTLNNNELKRIKRIARSDLAYFDFSLFTFHLISDSAGILTQDLQNRNLTLYTAKLRSRD